MKHHPDNPRDITDEQLNTLSDSMTEFGDLSGITINTTTGHIVTGNFRTEITDWKEADFTQTAEKDGDVYGIITWRERQFNVRFVNWTEDQERKAAILANKAGGEWNYGTLQEKFPVDMLLRAGFEGWEIGHFPDYDPGETTPPTSKTSIKKIHLFFTKEQFEIWKGLLDTANEPGTPTSIFINAANLYYAEHQDTFA